MREGEIRVSQAQWQGYVRDDGRLGIRNKTLVIYTVECSSFVANEVARRVNSDDVEVVGFAGCTDNDYAVRLLISLIRHPNVAGVVAIGLGCEYTQPEWLARVAEEAGKGGRWFFVQQLGGTRAAIDHGVQAVRELMAAADRVPRRLMGFGDLVIGAECGGSDSTSGLAGNPVVGRLFDQLVDAGGTAIFEEIVEAIGLRDVLCERAIDGDAAAAIGYTYDKALAYCQAVRQYSVSPGNFAGGLTTIEEKSMGAVVKSGRRPIQGVLKVGERPSNPGLWLLDTTPDPHWMQFGITNPNDSEGLMALISCGAHLTLFITGRGSVIGSAVAPVIKVTGNAETYRRMSDDMDFDASGLLDGRDQLDSLAGQLAESIIATASGQLTRAEELGHKEYCVPYKYQDKLVLKPRACDA